MQEHVQNGSRRARSLNLRQIEVFRAIMLTGSETDAAKVLEISQPAVSRLLATAERLLGVQLFDRVKGWLVPTPQAKALYREVEAAYRGVLRLHDVAGGLAAGSAPHVRIVTCASLGFALVPRVIAAFRRRIEGVRISLEIVPHPELIERVAQQSADLGIALSPGRHPAVVADKLAEGGLVCMMPQDHPLAGRADVRAADFASQPLISLNRATPLGQALDEAFLADGAVRDSAIEVSNTATAAALVVQGAGAAVIEALALPLGALAGIVARNFASTARFALTLLRNRSNPDSPAVTAFVAELRNEIASALFAGHVVMA